MQEIFEFLDWKRPTQIRFRLNYADSSVEVICNHLLLVQRLLDYFDSFQDTVPTTSGDAIISQHIAALHEPELFDQVRGRLESLAKDIDEDQDGLYRSGEVDGLHLVVSTMKPVACVMKGEQAVIVGNVVEHFGELISLVNDRLFVHWNNQGYTTLFASGVERDGNVTVFLSDDANSLSASALHLLEYRYEFLGSRYLVLGKGDSGTEVIGSPMFPRSSIGVLLEHPRFRTVMTSEEQASYMALPKERLFSAEKTHEVFLDKFYRQGRAVARGVLARIAVVHFDWQGADYVAEPIDRDGLASLIHDQHQTRLQSTFPYASASVKGKESVSPSSLCAEVPAFRVTGDLDSRVIRRAFREIGLLED